MQLNKRLLALKPSGIRRIGQIAKSRPGCIALSIGEPDLDTPYPVRQRISEAILSGDTHYPPNPGILSLRKETAEFVNRRFGSDYTYENVLITTGSTEALASAFLTLLNPGDEVIVPVPAFSLYETQISLAGGTAVPLDLSSDGYQISEAALTSVLSPRTRGIIFASPNNPTGTVLSAASLDAIRRTALAHDLFIIADSVYDQLVYTEDFPSLAGDPELRDRFLYVSAFSKAYAMTGVRMGYVLADTSIMQEMTKAHSSLVVSAPSFIQTGCLGIYDTDIREDVALYKNRLQTVRMTLDDLQLSYPEPGGAFYIFPSIEAFGIPDETFCIRLIEEEGLALVPSSCFGVPGHVRISFCYDSIQIEEGMRRLARFVTRLRASL